MTRQKPSKGQDKAPDEGAVRGEGDYIAVRRFQDAERSFARKDSLVRRKAREAAEALDGPDPHTEENLDKGLDETFPASDPIPISPGAD
jgi:hypothetical protein